MYEASTPVKKASNTETTETPKKKSPAALIVLMLVIVGAIIGGYFFMTSNSKPSTPAPSKPVVEEPEFLADATDALFTKDNLPKMAGDEAFQILITNLSKNFTGEEYTVSENADAKSAIDKLLDKEADLIFVSAPTEEQRAELSTVQVLRDALVFYVHKDNKVTNVKLDDIVDIYTGDTINWISVGGDDNAIIAEYEDDGSPLQKTFVDLVMKDQTLLPPTIGTDAFDKNAIAFIYYTHTKTYWTGDGESDVKLIGINDVIPTDDTLKSGRYPLTIDYYILTRKDDDSEQLALLEKALLSTRGQKLIEATGYVPVAPED